MSLDHRTADTCGGCIDVSPGDLIAPKSMRAIDRISTGKSTEPTAVALRRRLKSRVKRAAVTSAVLHTLNAHERRQAGST